MTHPKVVSLQPGRNASSTIPPIVNSVRQQARRQLLSLLKDLLNCTDDALFEMADRSHNDADHHLYFDSMRQIRLQRANIQRRFADELNVAFEEAFRPDADGDARSATIVADDIELVHNDDLEISVAISGIVSKITSQFSLPIMELTKRIDHLARHSTVNERRNPLGPQRVSEAFAHALECLPVDIRIHIIMLKLFERTVMQRMGPVYETANLILTQAGVLKDLRRSLGRGRNPHAGARTRSRPDSQRGHGDSPQTAEPGTSGAPGDTSAGYGAGHPTGSDTAYAGGVASFGSIQSLLAGLRGADEVSSEESGALIGTPQLLSLLNAVQAESRRAHLSVAEVPALLDLRQVVVNRAPDVTGEAMNHLGRADEDVVNFIGLLFDYILNDRNLAIPMKALIARLQIPIVKLAILDKAFFERASHPARLLLNELSSAGIGWSSAAELKRDAVYDKIESVVIRVLNGFSDNPGIFQELLDELRAFRQHDALRQGRMEQRVRERESGKARTLVAKQEVQKVINQKACGLRLPRELGQFLSDVWSRALVYVSVREGAGSDLWESMVHTLDELLWSLQPLDSLAELDHRDELRPDLLDRLTDGMSMVELPDAEVMTWQQTIREKLEEISGHDRAYLEDDATPPVSASFPELEEIVLAPPHEVTDNYQGEAAEPAFVEKINRLAEGSWVEIQQPGQDVLRCKLATIVKPGDRYVFVNRRGMKVAEHTRMQLARELQDDRLVVLNDAQVFDRALQAVIGNLRQIQSKSTRP